MEKHIVSREYTPNGYQGRNGLHYRAVWSASNVPVARQAVMVSALLVQLAQSHLRTEHRAMRAPQA